MMARAVRGRLPLEAFREMNAFFPIVAAWPERPGGPTSVGPTSTAVTDAGARAAMGSCDEIGSLDPIGTGVSADVTSSDNSQLVAAGLRRRKNIH